MQANLIQHKYEDRHALKGRGQVREARANLLLYLLHQNCLVNTIVHTGVAPCGCLLRASNSFLFTDVWLQQSRTACLAWVASCKPCITDFAYDRGFDVSKWRSISQDKRPINLPLKGLMDKSCREEHNLRD